MLDDFGFGFGGVDPLRALLPWGARGNLIEAGSPALLTQDHLGTTPVTAVGQKAGRSRSRWGGDYHQTQSLDAAKPIWGRHPRSGLRNLLQKPHDLTVAPWGSGNLQPVVAAGTLGGYPAFTLTDSNGTSYGSFGQALTGISGEFALSVLVAKTVGATSAWSMRVDYNDGASKSFGIVVNSDTGAVLTTGSWIAGLGGRLVLDRGDRWEVTVWGTIPAGSTAISASMFPAHFDAAGVGSAAAVGSQTIAAPQFERGSVRTAYQTVWAAHDITEPGQPDVYGLLFDATDDRMQTPAIPWGTDEATVIAVVRKMTDALGCISHVGSNGGVGGWQLWTNNGTNSPHFGVRGTGNVGGGPAYAARPAARAMVLGLRVKNSIGLAEGYLDGQLVWSGTGQGNALIGDGSVVIGDWFNTSRPGMWLYSHLASNRLGSVAEMHRAARKMAAVAGLEYLA